LVEFPIDVTVLLTDQMLFLMLDWQHQSTKGMIRWRMLWIKKTEKLTVGVRMVWCGRWQQYWCAPVL